MGSKGVPIQNSQQKVGDQPPNTELVGVDNDFH